ncbi:MAG: galactose mutarotase [Bacteroidales bacterium]|jgi:galactose mutarotase-like enzyme|nr:galactose mutarotase [Bacteroidales bacterium]MCI2121497.1 galactose mutarotase [Bacteroidales bacterium]MCI2145138.1 galactose mutarotase [Bacteroidales bacterium]
MRNNLILCLIAAAAFLTGCNGGGGTSNRRNSADYEPNGRWTVAKAAKWKAETGWKSGCDYIPANAINQIEMWSDSTFDPETVDKELGWAQDLGFTTMRVFLSSVVWENEPEAFKGHIGDFLTIAGRHGISPMFVFFDDCWDPHSAYGRQREPKVGVHNSGWVQDPSEEVRADSTKMFAEMGKYVKDILATFKNDKRIYCWDLYNEPGNSGHGMTTFPLLRHTVEWAREVNPSQPVTVGLWTEDLPALNRFLVENSDVISYHNYSNPGNHRHEIDYLSMFGRPMICTEYMARKFDSKFTNILPMLHAYDVSAINWGFVSGKTNTIYAWGDPHPKGEEPNPWFHDIYRQDHTPFDTNEVSIIRRVNSELTVFPERDFEMDIKDSAKGTEKTEIFVLRNFRGMTAQFTSYGARLVSLWVPAKDGVFRDVVWGFPNIKGYLDAKDIYSGPIVGRYGNRIGKSEFSIDGTEYHVVANEGENHLHGGGKKGFGCRVWKGEYCTAANGQRGVRFSYVSPAGECGYPGTLTVSVTYSLDYDDELCIDYEATTDAPTILNPTLHAYFNLCGTTDSRIDNHTFTVASDYYTVTTPDLIPTGEIASVEGTKMDFRNPTRLGSRIYDDNFVLRKPKGSVVADTTASWGFSSTPEYAATVYEPSTGIEMKVYTDQPGLQFYSGDSMNCTDIGKRGEKHLTRTGFAFETQNFPDAPNHDNFPSAVLRPGETYTQHTRYLFDVR